MWYESQQYFPPSYGYVTKDEADLKQSPQLGSENFKKKLEEGRKYSFLSWRLFRVEVFNRPFDFMLSDYFPKKTLYSIRTLQYGKFVCRRTLMQTQSCNTFALSQDSSFERLQVAFSDSRWHKILRNSLLIFVVCQVLYSTRAPQRCFLKIVQLVNMCPLRRVSGDSKLNPISCLVIAVSLKTVLRFFRRILDSNSMRQTILSVEYLQLLGRFNAKSSR